MRRLRNGKRHSRKSREWEKSFGKCASFNKCPALVPSRRIPLAPLLRAQSALPPSSSSSNTVASPLAIAVVMARLWAISGWTVPATGQKLLPGQQAAHRQRASRPLEHAAQNFRSALADLAAPPVL